MNFKPLRDYMLSLQDKGVPSQELIVCRSHEILYHECVGYSDIQRTRLASPSDRYWMYSCTKIVTAAAAMRALELGLFHLDDPVSMYLPAYNNLFLLNEAGERIPPKNAMTIRHLLTMTAGLDYNMKHDVVQRVLDKTNEQATTFQIAQSLAEKPLCFEPGDHFQYSLCHDVLGAVIEQASGMTLREFEQLHFFRPLNMKDTDFGNTTKPDRLTTKYTYDASIEKVVQHEWENRHVLSPNYCSGGAGLVSTAADFAKFADALACGGLDAEGTRILRSDSIDLMRSEQISTFQVNSTFSCPAGPDYGYGLGVRTRISSNYGAVSALGEFGWDGAAGADVTIDPAHELSMVYVMHMTGWTIMPGPIHLQLRDTLYPLMNFDH